MMLNFAPDIPILGFFTKNKLLFLPCFIYQSLFKNNKCRLIPVGISLPAAVVMGLFWWLPSVFASGAAALGCDERALLNNDNYGVEIVEDSVWVAGYYGTILYSGDRGDTWEIQKSNTKESLYALIFPDNKTGWVVGSKGTILHTGNRGKKWEKQVCPTDENLLDVFFISPTTGWISGTFGTVLHTVNGGKTWTDQSIDEDLDIYSVCFVDQNNGWVVGEYGCIYHTNDGGTTWTSQVSPIEITMESGESQCLFKVRFKDPKCGMAVGIDGQILYTENGGIGWDLLPTSFSNHLFDLSVKMERFFITGSKGFMAVYLGNTFYSFNSGSNRDLVGIDFGEQGLAISVGASGTLLRTMGDRINWHPLDLRGGN